MLANNRVWVYDGITNMALYPVVVAEHSPLSASANLGLAGGVNWAVQCSHRWWCSTDGHHGTIHIDDQTMVKATELIISLRAV